jgi:hypothetical protein
MLLAAQRKFWEFLEQKQINLATADFGCHTWVNDKYLPTIFSNPVRER